MYKIELIKGNWYNQSYEETPFREVRNLEHLRDVQFIGDNVVIIPRNNILIGKLPANDVVVDDSNVKRRQCRIEMSGEHICLRDLGARDHTLVLRQGQIHRASNEGVEIYVGDILKLRETELRLLEARLE
jgi:pSer/pThr/pTyr-binding forkhead associated (FHA) protein